ncbi:MAG: aminoglycoside phosphotransferase family protein, partial [Caldilineaceae bacterium]|nr:aminoglycoside phosphotransferase family protein [Caldilineaceae bacterium]
MDQFSEKAAILGRYGISTTEPLHSGMEAEVYALDDTTVLKLYPQTTTTANLETLQRFYASLVDATLSYALPEIHKVEEYGSYTVVLEKRLHGRPLSALVAERPPDQLGDLPARYIAAVAELSQLTMPPHAARYKLFDPDGISARLAGDWHTFLRRYLDQKLTQTAPYFARDVADYAAKVQQMQRTLAASYLGPHALIHGDFFPGNLLVDEQGCPTALLDFGLFTMYGDPLFDLATAWVLF